MFVAIMFFSLLVTISCLMVLFAYNFMLPMLGQHLI